MYCWKKLDLDLKLNLCCGTSGWSRKENYESIYPSFSCTISNDLFDDNTHLQVYIQCSIEHCCTIYYGDYYPLWRHRFWQCNHSMRTACTVHIPNRNHYTWGGQEILISPAAQLMESQTHIHFYSPYLKNE